MIFSMISNMEKCVTGLYLDLAKACDTADHDLLLVKSAKVGIAQQLF